MIRFRKRYCEIVIKGRSKGWCVVFFFLRFLPVLYSIVILKCQQFLRTLDLKFCQSLHNLVKNNLLILKKSSTFETIQSYLSSHHIREKTSFAIIVASPIQSK